MRSPGCSVGTLEGREQLSGGGSGFHPRRRCRVLLHSSRALSAPPCGSSSSSPTSLLGPGVGGPRQDKPWVVGWTACLLDGGAGPPGLGVGVCTVKVAWSEWHNSLCTLCSDPSSCNGLRPTSKKGNCSPIFEVIVMHLFSDSGFTEHLTTWELPQSRDERQV